MTATSQPLVSVVIPFYNCPFIGQSVESVVQQTYSHIEIIVVDDGSTLHREQLGPYGTGIRYFWKPNGGTASALNCGIRAARGEYIVW
jgi:teichuronic acid biosynthesis glycosyltransferase TuaG